jgi:hypothetical protein
VLRRFSLRFEPLAPAAAPQGGSTFMSRRKKIYEGKAKILFEGPEPGTIIQYFKDDATAFNAQKKAILEGKGVINNQISGFIMQNLNAIGVPRPVSPPLDQTRQECCLYGRACGPVGTHPRRVRVIRQGRQCR